MTPETHTQPGISRAAISPRRRNVALGMVGLLASLAGLWTVQPLQFNVVTYETVHQPTDRYLPPLMFAGTVYVAVLVMSFAATNMISNRNRLAQSVANLRPMILGLPLATYAFFESTPPFPFVLLFILGFGWTAYLAGRRLGGNARQLTAPEPRASVCANPRAFHSVVETRQFRLRPESQELRWTTPVIAVASLAALVVLATLIHTRIQINFFNHFMLGHADVGHFTEELKNALVGRGLRSDSFDNTRLGWHFVPLMYVLVPGYALWPSPVFLMTCGAFVLHVPALIVFWFARKRTDSILDGWLFATAWLLLPSINRLIYSNTYGFAWLYVSVPILAFLLAAAELRRWKACWLTVAVLLLCRETNAAVTLGFGIYLVLFSIRRRAGVVVVAVSIGYALLCALVLIPHFAAAGRYERLDLFGELGDSLASLLASPFTHPGLFFGRLLRPQSWNLVFLLLATMCVLPVRGWRLSLAALPTLVPLLLFQNPDWSSIKFWHHAMVLPFLFFAGVTVRRRGEDAPKSASESGSSTGIAEEDKPPSINRGVALALIVCAAWGHYFFGFSPVSKSYEVIASDAFLQHPDPRLEYVNQLRAAIPRDQTILATERIAAHFTDYKRIYTGRRSRFADFVVIDRSDSWDTSDLPKRGAEFTASLDYRVHSEFGPIIIFERRADAPPALLD